LENQLGLSLQERRAIDNSQSQGMLSHHDDWMAAADKWLIFAI